VRSSCVILYDDDIFVAACKEISRKGHYASRLPHGSIYAHIHDHSGKVGANLRDAMLCRYIELSREGANMMKIRI
jgi:hypothetical protein